LHNGHAQLANPAENQFGGFSMHDVDSAQNHNQHAMDGKMTGAIMNDENDEFGFYWDDEAQSVVSKDGTIRLEGLRTPSADRAHVVLHYKGKKYLGEVQSRERKLAEGKYALYWAVGQIGQTYINHFRDKYRRNLERYEGLSTPAKEEYFEIQDMFLKTLRYKLITSEELIRSGKRVLELPRCESMRDYR
jgi:hypothetical protein